MSGCLKASSLCQVDALPESAARFGGTPWLDYSKHLSNSQLLASYQSEMRSLVLTEEEFRQRYNLTDASTE